MLSFIPEFIDLITFYYYRYKIIDMDDNYHYVYNDYEGMNDNSIINNIYKYIVNFQVDNKDNIDSNVLSYEKLCDKEFNKE
jgi:hypothetical protein